MQFLNSICFDLQKQNAVFASHWLRMTLVFLIFIHQPSATENCKASVGRVGPLQLTVDLWLPELQIENLGRLDTGKPGVDKPG